MSGCPTTSVQAHENCGAPPAGLLSYPGLAPTPDIDRQYAIVALRNKPAGAPSDFAIVCEANLRSRGLLYWKTNPGDCPKPTAPGGGFSGGQIAGLSGMAASGIVGGFGAAGTISGPLTLGIGSAVALAVAGLTDLFTHHAQAVQTEQSTICAVAGYFNGLLSQVDRAVLSGVITYDQGITYVKQICQQAITGLQSIYKQCNAACVYQGILRAHADFVSYLYPRISPAIFGAQAPGSSPMTANTPPGAVPDAGAVPPVRSVPDPGFAYRPTHLLSGPANAPNSTLPSGCSICPDYLNMGYNQQTGQSGQYADVAPTGTNWVMWGAIAAIVAAFVAVLVVLK